jgi:DNA-directed RNA polymerase subunit RPC12/RpoP
LSGGEKKLIRCPSCGFEAEGAEFDVELVPRAKIRLSGVEASIVDDLYVCRCGNKFFLGSSEEKLMDVLNKIVDLLNESRLNYVETVILAKYIQLVLLEGLTKDITKRMIDELRVSQIER